ncbi:MAG TPA: hypothetical protein VKB02_00800 [Pyrinomonadaceae bacterium]|nr:hypothetical protein [Pyrinomonadaceae bacterium]
MTLLNHFIQRLQNPTVEVDPYPHFFLEHVFPEDYYDELLRHLPPTDVYDNLYEVTDLKLDHFRHRNQRDMDAGWTECLPRDLQPFWKSFNEWFLGPEVARAVLDSFGSQRSAWPEVSVESQFIRHRAGYFLGPHSDLYTKLVVLLIYLAPDNSAEHLGTSLYRPKDPSFSCPNSKHYPFEDFIRVKTAPYKPNSLLAFMRSDISFHGLEPLSANDVATEGRDVIQYVLHDKQVREAQLLARNPAAAERATT